MKITERTHLIKKNIKKQAKTKQLTEGTYFRVILRLLDEVHESIYTNNENIAVIYYQNQYVIDTLELLTFIT